MKCKTLTQILTNVKKLSLDLIPWFGIVSLLGDQISALGAWIELKKMTASYEKHNEINRSRNNPGSLLQDIDSI